MRGRAAQLERPARAEGFDELFYVCITDGSFNVSPWVEDTSHNL